MTNYVCKFHVYRINKLFSRVECSDCTPDIINNPNCPDYKPVEFKDMTKIKERNFDVVSKLEERVK